MPSSLMLVVLISLLATSSAFNKQLQGRGTRRTALSFSLPQGDHLELLQTHHAVLEATWAQLAAQGIADASSSAVVKAPIVCPGWGEPGWGPLCWLNGNPVFNAFDTFQLFIQNSIVSLKDFVKTNLGVEEAYGPSIIFFTICVRVALLPLAYYQLASSASTTALQPKMAEIRAKYPDDKNMQNQMIAMLYEETQTNPLAGCLPALFQLPVFVALYRSFLNLAQTNEMSEPFLWIPSLEGPVFGERNTDWIQSILGKGEPMLGWHDTLAYLSIPIILIIAQSISLRILTPPSDDPVVQKSQRILKYLPLMIGYFALSVPAGLGVYWIANNILSTVVTASLKEWFKRNPSSFANVDIDSLADSQNAMYFNPAWGYSSRSQMLEEARLNIKPVRVSRIPVDF